MAGSPVALATNERPISSARLLLLAVCPPTFIGLVNALALSPFLAVLAVDLRTSVSLLGQVPATMNVLAALLGLVVGPLADRHGQRRILLAGTLAVLVAGLLTAGTPVVAGLFAAAVFGAASRAVVTSLSFAVVSSRLSGDAARRALSWVVIAMGFSVLLGPPMLTTVGAALGWRAAFVALAMGGGLTALFVARLLPADCPGSARLDLRSVLHSYGKVVRHRVVVGLYGAALLRNTVVWSIGIFMGAFLVERRGLSLQEVGLAFAVVGAGQLVGGYVFGGRFGGFPLRPLLASLYVLIGASLAVFLVLPLDLRLAMMLLGLSFVLNAGGDVVEATLLARDTLGSQAMTMALYGTAKSLGTALGGSLGGLLIWLGGYESLGLTLPVLAAGAATFVAVSRKRIQSEIPAQGRAVSAAD